MMESYHKFSLKFFYSLEMQGMKSVLDWLMKEGLIFSHRLCPSCGKFMKLVPRRDSPDCFLWTCCAEGANAHRCRIGVRRGSIFEGCKLSMCDVMRLAYLWIYGAPRSFMRLELGMKHDTTASKWIKRFRDVCVNVCVKENEKLGGSDTIVEVDECKFGGKEYNKRIKSDCKWVYAGIERTTKKCFFEVAKNRSKKGLIEILKKYILPGTIIVSNCWKGYNCLTDKEYLQMAANLNLKFTEPEAQIRASTINKLWKSVKRDFRQRGFCSNYSLFDAYFFEYMWRNKYREHKDFLFPCFLASLKETYSCAPENTRSNGGF